MAGKSKWKRVRAGHYRAVIGECECAVEQVVGGDWYVSIVIDGRWVQLNLGCPRPRFLSTKRAAVEFCENWVRKKSG